MPRKRCADALVGLAVLAALLTLPVRSAGAAEQVLSLKAGWNLVSLHIEPGNADPSAVFADAIFAGALEAVWSYDAETDTWSRFPTVSDQPPLVSIETGRGYWVRATAAVSVVVEGPDDVIPQGPGDLVAGWNLLGFVSDSPQPYDRVFQDLPVRQIWTFDASARKFRGVILGAEDTAAPVLEDFSTIDPGKAYWVQAGEPASLEPQLATALPGDIDVAPLLAEAPGEDWGRRAELAEL